MGKNVTSYVGGVLNACETYNISSKFREKQNIRDTPSIFFNNFYGFLKILLVKLQGISVHI
jgi:hypothetical protein